MKSEKALQTYLIKQASLRGIFARKVMAVGRVGFPDVILIKGRVIFVELKSPTGKGRLSPMQIREIERLLEHGADVRVISQKEEADAIIEELTIAKTTRRH